ncbi:MAG: restriction endonuclease [bacterium]|nr:restriction endonuclease [bacterium]
MTEQLRFSRTVNVKPEYVRQIRAMLHAWEKFGLVRAEQKFLEEYYHPAGIPSQTPPKFVNVVQGKLSFLKMVIGEADPTYSHYSKEFNRLVSLEQFNRLCVEVDNTRRGYQFEKFMNRLFQAYEIKTEGSFKRNEGAEQIDGAFKMGSIHFLVECRWRNQPSGPKDTDVLLAKVKRSGSSTMGLFVSVNGWSRHVISTLKQNPDKVIILANGGCIRGILEKKINLVEFMNAKKEHLGLRSEPFLSIDDYLSRQSS